MPTLSVVSLNSILVFCVCVCVYSSSCISDNDEVKDTRAAKVLSGH